MGNPQRRYTLTDPLKNKKGFLFDSVLFAYLINVLYFIFSQFSHPASENAAEAVARYALSFLISLPLGLFFTWGFGRLRILTLGTLLFAPSSVKMTLEPKAWYKTFWGLELFVSFIATFSISVYATDFSFYELLNREGFYGAQRIFSALVTPEWSVLPEGIVAIFETIFIAFLSTAIAVPLSFVLSFFAAKNIMSQSPAARIVYFVLRALLNITRSIEPLIWAIIFSVWVGIGPFAGMLALMLHSVSSLTKQYSEILEGVEDGPIEGIAATGANAVQIVWYGIVPQIILPYISFTIYRWDINVRMATVIGLVGGGGIGTLLIQYQGQALWREVGALAFLIVLVVWALDTASAHIREALK